MAEEKDTTEKKAAPKKKTASEKSKAPKKADSKKPAGSKSPTKPKESAKKIPKKVPEGKVNLYSLDGTVKKHIELPPVFLTQFRPDVIRRAVKSARANRRQPYGPSPKAGMRHAVSTWGKGRGAARVQRITGGRTGAESPPNVGGRRAHPPRPERDWAEKINKKEKLLALRSAVAAVGNTDIVKERGHRLTDDMTVPLVLTDDFENLFDKIAKDYKKSGERPAYIKEAIKVLNALGLEEEMIRARDGIHIRAGRGKMRGRRLRRPKSILFVVSDIEKTRRCVGNIPGVDVITPERLNVEILAPGGDAGRLTVFTEKALMSLGGE
jgi:large subunit ribosomal protein L4e